MQAIEKEAATAGALAPAAAPLPLPAVAATDLLKPPLLQRMIVGSWVLITINTLIFGFVIFLPQFFLRQGLTITNSLAYTLVLSIASLIGCAVGRLDVGLHRPALEHHRRFGSDHRVRLDLRAL